MRPSLQRLPSPCRRRTLVSGGATMIAGPARAADRAFCERRCHRRTPPSHIHLLRLVAVAVAASVASTGCGKDEREYVEPIMSCNLEAIAECYEIIGVMSRMERADALHACEQRGGSPSDTTRCPTTAVVGTCSFANSFKTWTMIERYFPPTNPASAKVSCEQRNGVWASN